jgi:hypothetical protein
LKDTQNPSITIVFMHKPFWYHSVSVGKPDTLHSLFVNYAVDAVFTGHFHKYFSGKFDDIIYTGLGSSGGGTEVDPTGLKYHFCYVTVDEQGVHIAPIKVGSVLPWDITTSDEFHMISKADKFGFEMEKVSVDRDWKITNSRFAVDVHNHCLNETLNDTLRWEPPTGWTIKPNLMPIEVAPNSGQSLEFDVSCEGSLHPFPKAILNFPYGPGKFVNVDARMLIAREVECLEVSEAPTIDGALGEEMWRNPERRFFGPKGGGATTDGTIFYFAHDLNNLYVAAICTERFMDSMIAKVTDHDGAVYSEDCVGLFLQPNINENTAYQIYFNPLGTVFDQKLTMNPDGYYRGDRDWNGDYDVKTVLDENHWSIEMAITMAQFDAKGRSGNKWGLNFRRKQERLGSSANWQTPVDYDPKSYGIMVLK